MPRLPDRLRDRAELAEPRVHRIWRPRYRGGPPQTRDGRPRRRQPNLMTPATLTWAFRVGCRWRSSCRVASNPPAAVRNGVHPTPSAACSRRTTGVYNVDERRTVGLLIRKPVRSPVAGSRRHDNYTGSELATRQLR